MNESIALIIQNIPLLKTGLMTTILLSLSALVISLSIGIPFGILSTQQFFIAWLYKCIRVYVITLRAIPVYIQLLLVYFVLPDLLGINVSGFFAAILALGLCSSAYVTEIVRSSISALPQSQWDAGFVLGYTRTQSLGYTIMPQALKIMAPMLTNELESLIKSTAIVSTIGVLELTRMGTNIVARSMKPIPVYCTIAVLYLLVSLTIMLCTQIIERYVQRAKS